MWLPKLSYGVPFLPESADVFSKGFCLPHSVLLLPLTATLKIVSLNKYALKYSRATVCSVYAVQLSRYKLIGQLHITHMNCMFSQLGFYFTYYRILCLVTEPQNDWGWLGPLEVFRGPGDGGPCPGSFWVSLRMETLQPVCQSPSQWKSVSWCSEGNSWVSVCASWLWSCHLALLRRTWLQPVCTLPSDVYVYIFICVGPFLQSCFLAG